MSIALLQQHIKDTGMSQKQVGAQIGFSATVINQYLKGTYPGNVAAIDKAVTELVERHQSKAKDVPTDFVATPTAKKILDICGLAHAMRDVYLVIGEAGLGKTVALKEYASTRNNVVMIEIDPTFTTKTLLAELCDVLGAESARNNRSMMKAVIEKLKGSERLLIVDEAELLSYKPLEILRRIHDKTGVGIVLAGMPRLRANLRGSRGEYKQLFSRIGMALDIKTSLPEADINQFCEVALGTNEFNAELFKACHGNARRLNKLLRGVLYLSGLRDEPVSQDMIGDFTDMLID